MILYLNLDLLENTGKYLVFFYQKGTQRIIYCPATSKIMLFDIRLDMKKSLGRTTKYKVQFEDGSVKLLSLKRSEKKGNIPFSLITKAN